MTDQKIDNIENVTVESLPIVNCHIHTFTKYHVPPWLARSIVPEPFYRLLYIPWFLEVFKLYHDTKNTLKYKSPTFTFIKKKLYNFKIAFRRYFLFKIARLLVLTIAALNIIPIFWPVDKMFSWVVQPTFQFLIDNDLVIIWETWWAKTGIVAFAFLFIPPLRQLILVLIKQIKAIAWAIPDEHTKEILSRYASMGRFATYKNQSDIYARVRHQYGEKTHFIILPMDMTYMGAGAPRIDLDQQMKDLLKFKSKSYGQRTHPFIFIDPRRDKVGQEDLFKYKSVNNTVVLEPCYVKSYLEHKKYPFAGIKIYPALGYYPFEKRLLPLWLYAADNCIPIMTHCTKGIIYYRGSKKKKWDTHDYLFEYAEEGEKQNPLLLPALSPSDVSFNFTHPLNYFCLLEEKILRKIVADADEKTKELFGYKNDDTPLIRNLSHLKICFAHFGGSDQWREYLDTDRNVFNHQIIAHPLRGINFGGSTFDNPSAPLNYNTLTSLWKEVDWYSIISSMMLQFPHVYADVSYILHNPDNLPLLNETLSKSRPKLRSRVLFGTDFYVVRNQKSDKHFYHQLTAGISESDFNQIARHNPTYYLHRKF